jgi:hypothetical protein
MIPVCLPVHFGRKSSPSGSREGLSIAAEPMLWLSLHLPAQSHEPDLQIISGIVLA